jgi:deoxyribodipyrimidine photolyase
MNIFIHRRDLRIYDNTTLNEMGHQLRDVSPIFIFTPEQITPQNQYYSSNLV